MKDGKYDWEDFKTVFSPPMGDDDLEFIAERANKLLPRLREQWLAQLLRDAPTVYGTTVGATEEEIKWSHCNWVNLHRDGKPCSTHTARLIEIREIGVKK